jgi:hypothetical protein
MMLATTAAEAAYHLTSEGGKRKVETAAEARPDK